MSARHYRNDSVTKLEYTEDTRRSLYSMLSYGAAHASKEADAILYFGNVISYGALMDKVHSCAAGFLRLGIKKSDCVTIFLPNIPQCVIAVYALNRIGAVCNMVHPLSTKEELEYAVKLTDSRFVLTFESNEGLCDGLSVTVIRCRTPYYFPHNIKGLVTALAYNYSVRKCKKLENVIDWKDVMFNGKIFFERGEALPADDAKGSDTAVIMYTGGTTGDSKGVELSNAAMNYSAVELLMHFANGAPHIGDTILSILPAFHAFGFIVVIHVPLSGGLRLVFLPRFNPKQCAKLVISEQINYLAGVPVIYERLYPLLKDKDISCVHHAVCGGDKVTTDLLNRYNEILGKDNGLAELRPGYGLTEAAGCCLLTKKNYSEFIEGCVGSPLPGTEICLVEPGTTEVVEDDEGELCIINPGLMTGYYKNETATRQVLRKHDDGRTWLHTGDVVTLSGGDTVIFKSRYKRMVKINGINVYPTLIENTMSGCSLVDEVCAVAVPWKNDRRIKLYVTLAPQVDKEKASSEIMAYAKSHLNHWSTPFAVTVLDSMPLTKMNKTDYRVLEKRG
ncbi:MAG: class I adenylate-forming enzyme family protein [Methanocorpusculum sp.]|nr:class I adenylate-forming enzyme family protein [Methanocorpusculum sp.]